MRCFIALETDKSERAALGGWLAGAPNFPEVAPTPTENLHVTLEFLGELDAAVVTDAKVALTKAAGNVTDAGWDLEWTAPGAFPSRARPRVLWLGIADAGGQLAGVHAVLQAELRTRGLPADERPFRPHLTLGRLRRGDVSRARLAEIIAWHETVPVPSPSRVRGLALFQSRLGRGPALHERLLEASLG